MGDLKFFFSFHIIVSVEISYTLDKSLIRIRKCVSYVKGWESKMMDISPRYYTLNQLAKYSSLTLVSLRRHIKKRGFHTSK